MPHPLWKVVGNCRGDKTRRAAGVIARTHRLGKREIILRERDGFVTEPRGTVDA
jgi:hypothetical protein